ncbi:hypothetical protein [Dankookia sp. P2]|uniref:hypothetical protein n=1 Tax=Dankookia sp. P2 TaxID=3423955 RepID=UPI003D6770D4
MLRLACLAALLPAAAFAQVQTVAAASADPSFRLVNHDLAAMHEIYVALSGHGPGASTGSTRTD